MYLDLFDSLGLSMISINQSINQSIKALLSFCCTNKAAQQKLDYVFPGSITEDNK